MHTYLPPAQLLELVQGEVKGCTDVQRLHAAAGVLCQLAGLEEPVRSAALRSALILLANRYPKVQWDTWGRGRSGRWRPRGCLLRSPWPRPCMRLSLPFHQVRRYAAEQVYTLLLTFEPAADGSQDVEAAMEVVESTPWDGPLAALRPARAQLLRLLALPEPVAAGAAASASADAEAPAQQASGGTPAADENASYSALLLHAQRGM